MWPFKRSRRDTTHQQAGSAEPARPRARGRWRLVALGSLILLIVTVLGVFWADRTFWAGDDRLTGTVWTHQNDKATLVLKFGRLGYFVGSPVVRYTTTEGSASGRASVTYTVLDDKTLSLASGEKLTINKISSEQLVLSGGPWKLDKTEFKKQK
jgi:hypothetical protein